MRYLSLFSGIEAATVAWRDLGWQPLAFSEIEPFPCAVLQHHYPNVPNLGDITKVNWRSLRGKADVVIGGSPCQSFSIAGKREGLSGESGLMFEYIRAVREIRPKWFVWENVPGAFTVEHGAAFGQLLCEMDKLGYGLAWRVLDAQFFGVAQRRRRVFVVGHLGDMRAADVLFESESLRGDNPPSREKRKELAAHTCCGIEASGGHGAVTQVSTRTADWHQPAVFLQGSIPENAINRSTGGTNGPMAYSPEEPAPTPRASKEVPAVCLAFVQNQRDEVRLMGGDGQIAGAVTASQFTKGQTFLYVDEGEEGCLTPWDIQGMRVHSVNGALPALSAGGNNWNPKNVQPVILEQTIKACHDGTPRVLCLADDAANAAIDTDLCGTLKCGGMPPTITMPGSIGGVRRLTPMECERLQGFPDGYTDIPYKGKEHSPDAPRYKAIGNSFAVPVVRWIGERIQMVEKRIRGDWS